MTRSLTTCAVLPGIFFNDHETAGQCATHECAEPLQTVKPAGLKTHRYIDALCDSNSRLLCSGFYSNSLPADSL